MTRDVIVLMWLFTLVLAGCGLGVAGVAISMGVEGDIGVLTIFVPIGVLTLYGTYLFAREAVRAQRAATDPAVANKMRVERKKRRALLPASALAVLSAAFMPGPGTLKVVAMVVAALGTFVAAAATVAPRRPRGDRTSSVSLWRHR